MDEAKAQLARLRLHFPAILPTDERLAAPLAAEWLTVILDTGDPGDIVDGFVRGWTNDRPPRIADWLEARRVRGIHGMNAARGALAIEAGRRPIDPTRPTRAEIQARQRVDRSLAYAREHVRAHEAGESRWTALKHESTDALTARMLTYDEAYAEPAD